MANFFAEQNLLYLVLRVIVFILLLITNYLLFTYLKNNNVIANSLRNFYDKTQADVEERMRLEKMQRIESGNTDKEDFFLRLDKTILYSNIRKYIPFLNSNIYIFTLILFSALAFIIGTLIFDITIGLLLSVVVILFYAIVILALSDYNYNRVEANIVSFMNLVENYSKTNNDLVSIFGKVYPYLEEPLKSNIQEAYYLGKRTGNIDLALERLQNSVEHKRFKEIIRNLIICSHYEANYEEIIADSRAMLMEYLAGKREREAMVRNARIELSILCAVSAVVVWLVGTFMESNIILALRSSFIGQLILVYLIVVLAVVLFNLIFMGNNKE